MMQFNDLLTFIWARYLIRKPFQIVSCTTLIEILDLDNRESIVQFVGGAGDYSCLHLTKEEDL